MPKLYCPTPDELQGAKPLNELIWFEVYQEPLLELANTHEGRDLLVIDSWEKMPFPVVDMRKHAVTFQTGEPDGQRITVFRSGAYWGNVIRYRWADIKAAFDRMFLLKLLALPRLTVTSSGKLLPIPAGAATLTANPNAHPESSTVDGSTYRYSVGGEAWGGVRTGAGTTSDDANTTIACMINSAAASNTMQFIRRATLLFNTSVIGAGGSVSAAVMSFTVDVKSEAFGSGDAISVVASNPASNTALVPADYQTFGPDGATQTILAPNITITNINDNNSTYNNYTLNSTGLAQVDKGGITKLGCRTLTDNTSATLPYSWASDKANYIAMIAADHADDPAPKLVVTYTLAPFSSRVLIF